MKNLFILLLSLLVLGCGASKDPAERYAKKHEDRSFSYVMKHSESFTMGSLKDDKRTLKEKLKGVKKTKGKNSKKESLEETLVELRAKIEELENQR